VARAAQAIDVRERIFGAARELFARDGYQGTTTRRICERAGVPLGSLHYHFESKESLYLAVLESVIEEESGVGRRILGDLSGSDVPLDRAKRLEQIVRAWVRFLFDHADVARIGLHRIVEYGVNDFPSDSPSPLPAGEGVEDLLERALGVPRTLGVKAQILAANDIIAGFVGGAAHHARVLGISPESDTYRELVTRTVLALYAPLVRENSNGSQL
jgi:AcrR family transcriptional regulator